MSEILRKWKAHLDYEPNCMAGVTLDQVLVQFVDGIGLFYGILTESSKVFRRFL